MSAVLGTGAVGDHIEEGAILLVQRVVEDAPALAELVGTGVDEGRILEVLVPAASDGIEVDDGILERGATLPQEPVLVAQPLGDARAIGVVGVPSVVLVMSRVLSRTRSVLDFTSDWAVVAFAAFLALSGSPGLHR